MSLVAEFFDRKTAERLWFLENNGSRVSVFNQELEEMKEWCKTHCEYQFDHSYEKQLIDVDVYNRSILIADKKLTNPRDEEDWVARAMMDCLTRELQREIDRDILAQLGMRIPYLYFWFEDRNEAMLFKLTWGGE